ncbi:hypothetical protein SAMN04487996_111342 [Dyadobacter soli]|uniref:Uncharacterized protein n=1 Tax=Dyadobacter soli TaxID=659014 RepID=A0A1G7MQ22_9BACT|nr:hypothetical protein [Dyadobacter soli]SDF63885.1 hypothetical protein SAMN04487996_111342 [Dyadobacter soli]
MQETGILDFLENRILPIEQRHFAFFLLGALFTTGVGIGLALKQRSNGLIELIHAVPIFFAPILFSKILVDSAAWLLGGAVRASALLLVAHGILFHVWLSAFLLKQFDFPQKVKNLRHLAEADLGLGGKRAPIVTLGILILLRPIATTFTIVFIFFESMVAAPSFLDMGNWSILYALHQYEPFDPFIKARLSALVLALFAAIIFLNHATLWVIEYSLRMAIKNRVAILEKLDTTFNLIIITLDKLTYVSAVAFMVTTVIAASGMLYGMDLSFQTVEVLDILKTFMSDGLKIGIVTCLLVAIYLYSRLEKTGAIVTERLRLILMAGAVMPPVIYGVLGLSLAINKTILTIAGVVTPIIYCTCLLGLLIPIDKISYQAVLFFNVSKSGQPFKNKLRLLKKSNYVLLIPATLLTLYFLWVEDGIQYLLSNNENYLAAKIRGFSKSQLSSGVTIGLILSAIVILMIAFLWLIFNQFRFKKWRGILPKWFTAFVVILVPLVSNGQQIVQRNVVLKSQNQNLDITTNEIVLRVSGQELVSLNFYTESCLVYLDVDSSTTLSIKSLTFTGSRNTVTFKPLNEKKMAGISIQEIKSASSNIPIIKFSDLSFINFAIEGSSRIANVPSKFELILDENSSVGKLTIENARIPNMELHLSDRSTVNLTHVTTNKVKIDLNKKFLQHESSASFFFNDLQFEGDEISTEAILHIGNLNIVDAKMELRSKAERVKNFTLKLSECSFNDVETIESPTAATISIDSLNTTVDLSNIKLESELTVRTGSLHSISLSNIESTKNLLSSLRIHSLDSVKKNVKIGMFDIELPNISICIPNENVSIDPSFKFVNILGALEMSRNIVDGMNNLSKPAVERNSFFLALQTNGRICSDKEGIGKDALYLKKRVDMDDVSPILAFLLDWLTGFGIHPEKALYSFFLYFAATWIVCTVIEARSANARSVPKIASAALMSFSHIALPINPPPNSIARSIISIFRLMLFIQITLLSIYLGQITLQ